MAIVLAVILLVLGTVLFHFLSPWQLTPLASNWGAIDTTINISLWVTGIVFVLVNLFMAYAIFRFRFNKNRRARYEPENKKLEIWLTGLTTVGIAALLAPGLVAWGDFVTVPRDAHHVEVVGQQWHWSYRFPGEDGRFGAVSANFLSDDNPFGLNPDDPRGQDDVLIQSPVLVLPVDRSARIVLRSTDVLHNFKVPNFRAKMDAVPGQTSYIWLTPTVLGDYDVVCAQLCGIGHFAMRGTVRVVPQEEFDEWLAAQTTFAEMRNRSPGDPAAGQGMYATCIACHGAQGEGSADMNAPALAGMASWSVERQLRNFQSGARGTHPEDIHGQTMRPFATMLADDAALRNVAAYVESLPPGEIERTVSGDLQRGQRLYRTCAHCHGDQGQGNQAVNGPPLAGLQDWYLVTQLNHFRDGVRGRHPEDKYGNQMVDMAQVLVNDATVRAVVAYIKTLSPAAGADADETLARRNQ
jgi:cytochrome c oxidase subunit II